MAQSLFAELMIHDPDSDPKPVGRARLARVVAAVAGQYVGLRHGRGRAGAGVPAGGPKGLSSYSQRRACR